MNKLLRKKLTRGGFTLAELLIVVAIIAVLVAVAVPIFTGSLEKARLGVHKANARNLKTMAVADILGSNEFESHADVVAWNVYGSYNFTTQEFEIKQIQALTSKVTNPSMAMYVGKDEPSDVTSMMTTPNPLITGDWARFGASDHEKKIGKVGTVNTCYYYVQVTAQDIDASVTWPTP